MREARTAAKDQKSLRVRHNDFDHACRYWWADRSPRPPAVGLRATRGLGRLVRMWRPVGPGGEQASDAHARNVDFGGATTSLSAHRCVVCRPFTETEASELLAFPAAR